MNGSHFDSGFTWGQTNTYPEGLTTRLFLNNAVRLGTPSDLLYPYPDNQSIETWEVGTEVLLLVNGDYSLHSMGVLDLSYRGSAPPSAYVPLPAAFWLFGSALLAGFRLRKQSS